MVVLSGLTIIKLWHRKTARKICHNTCFFWSVLSVYGQSHICIFPYLDRIRESDQIWETTDRIPSIYEKIRIMESPYFGIFHTVESSWRIFDFDCCWRLKACHATVDCLSTFEKNAKQLSKKSRFYMEKALQKSYCGSSWISEASIANIMALSHYFELSYVKKEKEREIDTFN